MIKLMKRLETLLAAASFAEEGEFETASFYMTRGAYRAARGRYREIIEKYPNFSQGDQAMFGMAQCLEHLKTPKDSVPYYSRLVRDFPLSPHVDEAKARLVAMKQPVPKPTKATLARAQADASRIHSKSLLDKLALSMSGTPDTSATLRGPVELGATGNGIEMAKRAPNAPVVTNASIIAQPLNDSSLGSGATDASKFATDNPNNPGSGGSPDVKPGTSANEAAPKTEESAAPPASNPANGSTGAAQPENKAAENPAPAKTETDKAKSASASTSQDQPANTPTQKKKKSKFHVLKKIVPPI